MRRSPPLGAVLALAACSSPTAPNSVRLIGRIDPFLNVRPVVTAPPQVRSGVAFTATVTTVGSPDCTTAEGGTVEVHGELARLVPYDRYPGAGHDGFCSDQYLATFPRDLQVTLNKVGAARIRVVGLSATSAENVLDSVEVAVDVLP